MKNIGSIIAGVLFIIFVIGFGIKGSSSIPDNAKIIVIPETKEWIPSQSYAVEEYQHITGKRIEDTEAFQATWIDVTSKGDLDEFALNDKIRNINSWVDTEPKALILHLAFGPRERWDSEGNWLY